MDILEEYTKYVKETESGKHGLTASIGWTIST